MDGSNNHVLCFSNPNHGKCKCAAARIITRTPSIQHITPVLHQLHWLPTQYRIQFKTLLLTFKAIHNLTPLYLTDLLHIHTPSRSLRSSSSISHTVPPARLTTMGSRAFSCSAPHLISEIFNPWTLSNPTSKHICLNKLNVTACC